MNDVMTERSTDIADGLARPVDQRPVSRPGHTTSARVASSRSVPCLRISEVSDLFLADQVFQRQDGGPAVEADKGEQWSQAAISNGRLRRTQSECDSRATGFGTNAWQSLGPNDAVRIFQTLNGFNPLASEGSDFPDSTPKFREQNKRPMKKEQFDLHRNERIFGQEWPPWYTRAERKQESTMFSSSSARLRRGVFSSMENQRFESSSLPSPSPSPPPRYFRRTLDDTDEELEPVEGEQISDTDSNDSPLRSCASESFLQTRRKMLSSEADLKLSLQRRKEIRRSISPPCSLSSIYSTSPPNALSLLEEDD